MSQQDLQRIEVLAGSVGRAAVISNMLDKKNTEQEEGDQTDVA